MTTAQVATVNESAELVLTQELLQQIGVGAGDKIEIAVNDRTLIVRALEEVDDQQMDEMMESIMHRYDNLFRRLAEGVE